MRMTAISLTALTASCSWVLGLQRARGVDEKSPLLLTQCFMEAEQVLVGIQMGD